MKVVIRHNITGRYYQAPGKWVRRSDNALTFDAVEAARRFSRTHQLAETQAVHRLAPYLMPLLHRHDSSIWESWMHGRAGQWYSDRAKNFGRN